MMIAGPPRAAGCGGRRIDACAHCPGNFASRKLRARNTMAA